MATASRDVWADAAEADFWVEHMDAGYGEDGHCALTNSYRCLVDPARRRGRARCSSSPTTMIPHHARSTGGQ
jgi:hypothetical protein